MNIVHRALRKAEAIVFLVDLASLGLALLTARLHRKATRQAQPDATGGVIAFDRSRCALQGYRFHTRDAISLAFFQTIMHARVRMARRLRDPFYRLEAMGDDSGAFFEERRVFKALTATICFATPFARVALAQNLVGQAQNTPRVRSRLLSLFPPRSSWSFPCRDVPRRADMYSHGEEVHD